MVPKNLRNRIRIRAAIEGKPMQELVTEVLEAAFPPEKHKEEVAV